MPPQPQVLWEIITQQMPWASLTQRPLIRWAVTRGERLACTEAQACGAMGHALHVACCAPMRGAS